MASSLTQSALRSLAASRPVIASARAHKVPTTAELNRVFSPVLREGEVMPDWDMVQELNARLLENASDEVVLTDQVRVSGRTATAQQRDHRDDLTRVVQQRYLGAQLSMEAGYGREALAHVGLDDRVARHHLAACQQGKHVVIQLRDPGVLGKLPSPRSNAAKVEPTAIADEMAPDVEALSDFLDELDRELKESNEKLVAREKALERLERLQVYVTRNQEALYKVAGLDGLAKRMRLVVRKRKSEVTSQEEEPDQSPSPDSPATDSP